MSDEKRIALDGMAVSYQSVLFCHAKAYNCDTCPKVCARQMFKNRLTILSTPPSDKPFAFSKTSQSLLNIRQYARDASKSAKVLSIIHRYSFVVYSPYAALVCLSIVYRSGKPVL